MAGAMVIGWERPTEHADSQTQHTWIKVNEVAATVYYFDLPRVPESLTWPR